MLEVLEVDDICEVYQDRNGQWRWTSIAATGKIVGTSDEAFDVRADCVEDAKKYGYLEE